MPNEETEIVEALKRGIVAGGFGPARHIETHLSHVFLAGDRAIKLKRRVKVPFADFRTIERRRATLEAEFEINRRTAAELYLKVLPLTRSPGGFSLDGPDKPIDWVLVMRRFPDDALFDTMAREGRLSVPQIEATAEIIARFHRSLAPAERPTSADYYAEIIEELRQTEADGAAKLGIVRSSQHLFDALGRALEMRRTLIEGRAARGHVRHTHGDLHLRNICLFEGRPALFDALEFDVDLATTDTLYDIAFLLMDLQCRGLNAHANAAMNAYWNAAGEEEEAMAGLPFFMALRAAVRMAVLVEAGKVEEADAYRALGLDLLQPIASRLVAIGGLSGTGKSVLAKALAPRLEGPCGARLLRSDLVRKQLAGMAPTAALPAGAYGKERRMAVYSALAERALSALDCASVVADATFREAETRALIESVSRDRAFTGLWLHAPLDIRIARTGHRFGDASDADPDVAAAQSEPESLSAGWIRIDASGSEQQVLIRASAACALGA